MIRVLRTCRHNLTHDKARTIGVILLAGDRDAFSDIMVTGKCTACIKSRKVLTHEGFGHRNSQKLLPLSLKPSEDTKGEEDVGAYRREIG